MAAQSKLNRRFRFITPSICLIAGGIFVVVPNSSAQEHRSAQQESITDTRSSAAAHEEASRKANKNVVTIMGSGRLTSYTYFAEDISNVIESIAPDELRVVAMLGKSGGHNVKDVLHLKGIDMGLADQGVLDYLQLENPILYADIHEKINYITKIFNAAHRFYGKADIRSLEDLRGRKVSCLKEGSTAAFVCHGLFRMLKIDAEIVYNSGEVAHQKILSGEVAAAIDGAPAFNKIQPENGGLHFIPISEANLPNSDFDPVRATYLPARLTHEEHPNWIAEGQEIPTVASGSLLVVYAWPKNTERYRRLEKFVDLFFGNIDEFRKPPRNPKWVDINLAAEVPGWKRFPAAQEWLDARLKQSASGGRDHPEVRRAFEKFILEQARKTGENVSEERARALYSQFVQWWEKTKAQ